MVYLADHGNKNITDAVIAQVIIQLLQNAPNDVVLWWDLAIADHRSGNDMRALQAVTAAMSLAPHNPTLIGRTLKKEK